MGTRFAALLAGVVAVLLIGTGSADAAMSDVETPTVTGPVPVTATSTPWAATDKPLASYGYVEQEFKYSGDAFAYDTTGDIDQTATRITTGGPGADGKHPYKTRMIVRRPADPADFNGTVVVEWQNVTAQFDLEANWFGDPDYLLKNGYAYVAISAQRVGVNSLRSWNAARYGDLDVSDRDPGGVETICPPPTPACVLPSDALSYDIYGAGIKALLGGGNGADPLGPLVPTTTIATGESQSGGRLNTYYNKIQPIHELADAFLLTVAPGTIRDDRPEPMIRVLSENENRVPRTAPDAANYRQWEVAGGSHLPRMAFENFQAPVERDLGLTLSASCTKYPLSRVQWPLVVNSAYAHLVDWANGGAAPPIAPRGQYDPGADPAATDQLVRNGLGIAEGGIRLPEVTVPVRVNTGINTIGSGGGIFSAFCPLLGSTEDLSDGTVLARYKDFADYMGKVAQQTYALAGQGFILPQDVPRLLAMHRAVPNVRPTVPVRSAGAAQNKGAFTLTWRGTQAPQSTFELQHSKDGGMTWSAVAGAGAIDNPPFALTEAEDGNWTYRVRSNTTIPADAVRAEYVQTTPFSVRSSPTLVDGSGPKIKLDCPKQVEVGEKAFAVIEASDKGVGLAKDPSGKQRIKTGKQGKQRIKVKATDKLGNKSVAKCKVEVVKKG